MLRGSDGALWSAPARELLWQALVDSQSGANQMRRTSGGMNARQGERL
jgi:hypothetical protein